MANEQLIEQLKQALQVEDAETLQSLAKEYILAYEEEALGYYFLAESYILSQEWEDAELLMAKAMDLAKENNIPYVLRLAYIKESQDEHEEARLLYDLVLEKEPENISALVGMARYYFIQEEDLVEALVYINKAETMAQDDAIMRSTVLQLKVSILLQEGETEVALDILNNLLKGEGTQELYLLKLQALSDLIYALEGNPEQSEFIQQAEDTYNTCMHLFKDQEEEFRFSYASFLAETNQLQKAEALFENILLPLDKENEEDRLNILDILQRLNMIYEKLEDTNKQLEVLTRMIELDEENWDAYATRAALYVKGNNIPAALADYKLARKLVSPASLPYFLKEEAEFYLSIKDYKSAFNDFKELATFKFEEDMEDNALIAEGFLGMAKVYHITNNAPINKIFDTALRAIQLGSQAAIEFVTAHCGTLYAEYNAAFLETFKPYFQENKNNAFLKDCFNKVWKYDPDANDLSYLPSEAYEQVLAILQNNIFFFTEQGLLTYDLDADKGMLNFYKVNNTKKNSIILEVTPTSGQASYEMEFAIRKGKMVYQGDESDEDPMYLQAIAVEDLSEKDKAFLKEKFATLDLSLLGESATNLIQVLN